MGSPLFTITEFAAALAKARKAESGLVTGDGSDPAVRKVKGFSYKELCDLAQIVTFCDDASAADRLTQIEHDSTDLFQRVLATPHTRAMKSHKSPTSGSIPPIANTAASSCPGKIHGGEIAGDMYEYGLSTEAGGEVKILVPKPLDTHLAADGKSVGIVGSIIDQPAQKISGYIGNSPRADLGPRRDPPGLIVSRDSSTAAAICRTVAFASGIRFATIKRRRLVADDHKEACDVAKRAEKLRRFV